MEESYFVYMCYRCHVEEDEGLKPSEAALATS
jgi:hypothetical protein